MIGRSLNVVCACECVYLSIEMTFFKENLELTKC